MVSRVLKSGRPLFMTEELDRVIAEQQSIMAMRLGAVACIPLYGIPAEGDTPVILGILYVDSTKPMHSLTGLDEKIVSKLALEAANVLERIELVKSIEQRQALEQELALAEETQKALLPTELPEIEGFRFCGYSKPTRYVGGDFYDFMPASDDGFYGLLGDVSGKGVAASLVSSMALGCLRTQLRSGQPLVAPAELLNQLLFETSPGTLRDAVPASAGSRRSWQLPERGSQYRFSLPKRIRGGGGHLLKQPDRRGVRLRDVPLCFDHAGVGGRPAGLLGWPQ